MKFKIFICALLLVLPVLTFAADQAGAPCANGASSKGLCNPIQGNLSTDDLQGLIGYAIVYVGSLLGFIAVITVVYGGVRIMMANGNDKTISEAKNAITYAIIGLVLAVFAYAGVVAIENLIGVQRVKPDSANIIFNPFATDSLKTWVETVLKNVISLTGILAVVLLLWNGFRYITSRGDEHKIAAAKKGITWSLVGLLIILFAYTIIAAIAKLIS